MPNRINVDTRAYGSGVLTAVVLEAGGHRFLEAVDSQFRQPW
jgi:hypothetical protein